MSGLRFLTFFLIGLVCGLWARETLLPPAPRRAAHAEGAADALIEIVGIGPAFSQALQDAGIVTFAQLARQDADALAERLGNRVPAERIRRERWIEQARERSQE